MTALALALLGLLTPASFASPASDRCRRDFTAAAALSDARPPAEPLRWELLAYYKWRAFAAGDPAACAPLQGLSFRIDTASAPVTGAAYCRDLFTRLSFARAYAAKSPELERLCLDDVATLAEGRPVDEELTARFRQACRFVVERVPPERFCPKVLGLLPFPEKMRAKEGRRCVCDFTSLDGRGTCHDAADNDPGGALGPYRYDAFNALHAALARRDPEACGTLELCRGLAGQAAAMAELHLRKAAALFCDGAPGDAERPLSP